MKHILICLFTCSMHYLSAYGVGKSLIKFLFKSHFQQKEQHLQEQLEKQKLLEIEEEQELLKKLKTLSKLADEELNTQNNMGPKDIVISHEYEKNLLFKKKIAHAFLESLNEDWKRKKIRGYQYASYSIYSTDKDNYEILLDEKDQIIFLAALTKFKDIYSYEKIPQELPHVILKELTNIELKIFEHIKTLNNKLDLRKATLEAHKRKSDKHESNVSNDDILNDSDEADEEFLNAAKNKEKTQADWKWLQEHFFKNNK